MASPLLAHGALSKQRCAACENARGIARCCAHVNGGAGGIAKLAARSPRALSTGSIICLLLALFCAALGVAKMAYAAAAVMAVWRRIWQQS